jgi:hypothetical protein
LRARFSTSLTVETQFRCVAERISALFAAAW